MKHVIVASAISAILLLQGCDTNKSAAEYLESAHQYLDHQNLSAATIEFKNAIRKSPDDPTIRLSIGKVYLQQRLFDRAVSEISRAAELGLPKSEWQLPLMQSMLGNRDYQELLDQPITLNQMSELEGMQVTLLQGIAALRLGETERAISYFEQASMGTPSTPIGKLSQAFLAQTQSQYEQALSLLDEALMQDPHLTEARLLKVQLLKALQRYADASMEMQFLISRYPNELRFQLIEAENQLQAGQPEQARPLLESVLKANPKHPYTNLLAAQMSFQTQQYLEAKRQAQQVLSVDQHNVIGHAILGLSTFQLGENEQAQRHLALVAPKLPSNHPLLRLIAQAQFLMGNPQQVSESLSTYQIQSEEDLSVLSSIAVGLARQQELPLALELMDRVHQSNPNNETLAQIGLLKLANRDESGLADLTQAMTEDPELQRYRYAPALYHISQLEYDKANQLAKAWLKEPSTAADGHNVLGLVAMAQGNSKGATYAFNRSLNIDPINSIALSYLSHLHAQSQPELAIEHIQTLLSQNPNNFKALHSLAQLEYNRGHTVKANALFTERLNSVSDEHRDELRFIYAQFLHQNGQNEETLKELALLSPDSQQTSQVLRLKTIGQYQLNRHQEALSAAQLWQQRFPKQTEAYLTVIELAMEQQETSLAVQSIEQAHQRFPDDARFAVIGVRFYIQQQNYEQARRMTQSIAQEPLRNALLAEWYAHQQQYEQATKLQQQVVAQQSNSFSVRRLANYQQRQGLQNAANETLKAWLVKTPEDIPVRLQLAEQVMVSSPAQAIEAYQEVLEYNPNQLVALNNLAWLQAESNQLMAARKTIDRALSLVKDNANVLDTYGYILLKQKRPESAIAVFEKALQYAPSEPTIQLNLAKAYLALHNEQRARQTLQTLLAQTTLQPPMVQQAELLLSTIN